MCTQDDVGPQVRVKRRATRATARVTTNAASRASTSSDGPLISRGRGLIANGLSSVDALVGLQPSTLHLATRGGLHGRHTVRITAEVIASIAVDQGAGQPLSGCAQLLQQARPSIATPAAPSAVFKPGQPPPPVRLG